MKFFVVGLWLLLSATAFADSFEDAITAFERGDYASAETTLHSILQANPSNASALGLLGAVLDSEKKYSEAEDVYRRAIRLNPRSAMLLNNYANHQMSTGDLAGARATYMKVLVLDPSRANANLQLASFAVEEKKGAEALRYLNHLQSADRNAPPVQILEMRALFLLGRDTEAKAIMARLLSGSSNDPRLNFSLGLALASAAKYDDAEAAFSRTLENSPSNFDVLYNLGLAAYHARHFERARGALQTALAQRPQNVDTLYNLAGVNIDLKQRERALQLLAEASRLDSGRADVEKALAQTSSALGYYADSRLAYERYLKLRPKDEEAQREYAFTVALSLEPREGLARLKEFLRQHSRDATAYYEVGLLEAKADPADAATQFDKAIILQPDFIPAKFGRGVLNLLQGNAATALPDLELAARTYPDNSTVLDRLGEAYTALNRPADAVKTLQKASAIAPRDSRILMHLSRALAKAGRSVEARETLARFRAIGPQPGNLIPQAGVVDFLSMSLEQQQARYREEVKKRLDEHPQDPDLNTRYLKVLLEEGKLDEVHPVAARLLESNPPAPLAAEAGHALVEAEQYAEAEPLLQYALSTPLAQLDLAIAVFHTAGGQQGLAQLERIPEKQRSGDFYMARAEMLESAGSFEEAVADLHRALNAAPIRADLYEAAAAFLERHRLFPEAVQLLDRAAKTLPDDPKILLLKAEALDSEHHVNEAERVLKQIHNRWPEWAPAYVKYGVLLERENRPAEAKAELDTALGLGVSEAAISSERSRLGS
jgi:tetratricopeptide (TPR) repeat protein